MYRGERDQRGFTVYEILLVVVILIVLLSVSLVGLVSYARRLQLKELDNSAREIFLAAQNRAILLSGGQRLEDLVVKSDDPNRIDHVEVLPGAEETTQISVYYIHCQDDDIQELLPAESIDPALWEGDFYITYEPESGSVVDVFYAEKPLPVVGDDFPAFYTEWRGASQEQRMDNTPMIGYYGGEAAESGTAISLRTPVINIENGDTLTAQVTYWLPRSLAMTAEANNMELAVELTYGAQTLTLPQSEDNRHQESSVAYIAYSYTWTLDTLNGEQFRNLFGAGTSMECGGDFTITAEVSYDGTLEVNGARKTATDNSLFAKGSGGETAYIACLRHLQNLDAEHSAVAGKTSAIQKNRILTVDGYPFDPIENDELQSYDGQEYTIEHVTVRADGPAGLFGSFGSEDDRKTLTGIRLVNTTVTGGAQPVGALVGQGTNLTLTNCQVYWENQSDEYTNLRYLLGDSSSLRYQVTGSGISGGLAGALTHSTIQNCSASTLVSGDTAGGLVGQGSDLTISGSYAASYVRGDHTAGLVGSLTAASSIDRSYAVGYLATNERGTAAGLCLGAGPATVSRSYSAMLFTVGTANDPLCTNGAYTKTRYLDSELFHFGSTDQSYAASYDTLVDPAQWDTLFGDGTFTAKATAQSHPYNLQTTLTLTNYTYPGLAELDHWGDWGAQFQNGSLVYYEKYESGAYGFSGGGVNHLQDALVVEDGYAMAYRGNESGSGIDINLSIRYQTSDTKDTTQNVSYGSSDMYVVKDVANAAGRKEDYYLLPLPEDIVNTSYAAADFYQKITVENHADKTEKSYYYNPHFADAILPYDPNTEPDQLASLLRVAVRSPRHLYNLSQFPAYYASTHQYRFLQQLDLDYDVYTGYDLFPEKWSQNPIGVSAASPFRGSYYGNCHTISGVVVEDGDYQYVGLFGYTTGVVQDVVYHMTKAMTIRRIGSSTTIYGGGLVGYNGGTVDNCAVSGVDLEFQCFEYSTAYLGGLVGINDGVIRDSAAEVADLTANTTLSNAYAGGFVGQNASGGAIDRCYAVGSVSAARARHGTVYACGFAGRNKASVNRSYAAVRLTVSGDASSFGFCPDRTTGCVYLNDGNFTYRNEHYAAQYSDSYATAATWAQLTGADAMAAVSNLGMSQTTGGYPYPTAVTDGTGQPVHYGQWPDAMELGTMGVYYWEKLEIGDAVSYHISAISQADGQVVERSTLSTAHGDGGVVTEYGYGYFYAGDKAPNLVSEGLYWNDYAFSTQTAATNEEANRQLSALMGGRYTFRSYNTWQADKQQGLHLVVTSDNQNSTQPPVGTWTLDHTFTVYLNPFFANSVSTTGETRPGTQTNPYEVRSIEQLQFINWYAWKGTKSVNRVAAPGDGEGYLFLSNWLTGANGRQYNWVQTHDLDGSHVTGYTPIAALYDTAENGKIIAWFSGSYNGNDYTIQEVDISTENVNTTGLFGVAVNAELKNIVLYSPSGDATITAANTQKAWYAIGGLVGLAANTGSSDRTIENCAVAGYTIVDQNGECAYGGGGVGGLVGICNMALKNCTATTDIVLAFTHSDEARNVRVGGIAGSCQQSITNCYSGGTISLGASFNQDTASRLHVGGITGGYFMKTLSFATNEVPAIAAGLENNQVPERLVTEFRNCYTYVEVQENVKAQCTSRYAIGGLGEIERQSDSSRLADYEGCYYLSNIKDSNAMDCNKSGVTNCTYASLSGGDAFTALQNTGFSTVTTETTNKEPLNGRYSFANDLSLLGTDYPFPTILTQSSDVAPDGVANVHYGDWPIEGIRRAEGALPVNLDLFSNYQELQGAVRTETLTLSAGLTGGTWNAESADPEIATAKIDQTGHLAITGQSAGSTIVTVSYGGYTLEIEVNVTAQLRLTTAGNTAITSFTDATVAVPLQLTTQSGGALPESLLEKITLSDLSVEFDPDYFTAAKLTDQDKSLYLTADGKTAPGSTQMTAAYTFTYLGTTYQSTSVLSLYVVEPVIEVTPVAFVFDGEKELTVTYTGKEQGQFVLKLREDGEAQTLEQLHLTAYEEVAAEFKDVAWVQWAKDDSGAPQVGTLSITAYAQPLYPAAATVRVQYQFQYGGSTHTLWLDLPIELKEPQPEEPVTPPEEYTEEEVQQP